MQTTHSAASATPKLLALAQQALLEAHTPALTPEQLLTMATQDPDRTTPLRQKLLAIAQRVTGGIRELFKVDREALPGLVHCLIELEAAQLLDFHHDPDRDPEHVQQLEYQLHQYYLQRSRTWFSWLPADSNPLGVQAWASFWRECGAMDHDDARVFMFLVVEDHRYWELAQAAPAREQDTPWDNYNEYDGVPRFGVFDDFERPVVTGRVRDPKALRAFRAAEGAVDSELAARAYDATIDEELRDRQAAADLAYTRTKVGRHRAPPGVDSDGRRRPSVDIARDNSQEAAWIHRQISLDTQEGRRLREELGL